MSDRLSVDELMIEVRQFFDLVVANIDHDGLVCGQEDCDTRINEILSRNIALGFGRHEINGECLLSHFSARLICDSCRKSMPGDNVLAKAPAYDELLP